MSAAVAPLSQQLPNSPRITSISLSSRMGTKSPVDSKRNVLKTEGESHAILYIIPCHSFILLWPYAIIFEMRNTQPPSLLDCYPICISRGLPWLTLHSSAIDLPKRGSPLVSGRDLGNITPPRLSATSLSLSVSSCS